MAVKRWITAKGDKALSREISSKYGISPFAAHLLTTRGVTSDDEIESALNPNAEPLLDPFLLPDMEKAVVRIKRAVDSFELISIYGDYDVDGITATALIYSYLNSVGARVMWRLPSRDDGGYGLHLDSIDEIAAQGATLLITVDNGISANEEIAYAAQKGIDVIVTDHHQPPPALPEAVAIVDAHLSGCDLPFRDYAGVGVAFKLVCAMSGDTEKAVEEYADLVALGTIADSVPLVGENRKLCIWGLSRLRSCGRAGLRALMETAGVDRERLTASDVSFVLAPRLNSAGRLGKPDKAVSLLLAKKHSEGFLQAESLEADNQRRHDCEKSISERAWKLFESDPTLYEQPVTVIAGENWPVGVIGIFAARLSERLGKPAVVLAVDGDTARGSCRGPEGFSFHEALSGCADLFLVFGGHRQAAGFSIRTENIDELRTRLNEYASGISIPVPVINADAELPLGSVTTELALGLAPIEPFGTGNPVPLVVVRDALLETVTAVGGGMHQRLTLSAGSARLTAMLFGVPTSSMQLREGDKIDCVLSVGVKYYRGVMSLDSVIRDIRLSSTDTEDIIAGEKLFERAARGEILSGDEAKSLLPTRDETAAVYNYIKRSSQREELETIAARLSGISYAKLRSAALVLEECGLVRIRCSRGRRTIGILPLEGKTSLEKSPFMQKLMREAKVDA